MKPVKTMSRFQCDFCKKRAVKHAMEKHERRCFRNPDRFCDYCDNTGKIALSAEGVANSVPCPYCEMVNKQQLAEIEAREQSEAK